MPRSSKELTAKQRHFCRLVAAGNLSQAEAYRTAYNCTGNKKTQIESASRLARDPDIAAMIRRLIDARDRAQQDRVLSHREIVIDRLLQAVDDDSFGVNRIRAIDILATVSGMKKHSLDIKQDDRSADTIVAELEAKLAALGLGEIMNHGEVIEHDEIIDHDEIINDDSRDSIDADPDPDIAAVRH